MHVKILLHLFVNISLNCLAKEKSLQDGPQGKKGLQIIGLSSAAELAIYGLDYPFKMNNNPVTTAVERY